MCTLACIICGKKKYWGEITQRSKCYCLHVIQSGRDPYRDTTISSSLDFYYKFLRKRNYQAVVSGAEKKFWVFSHGLLRRPCTVHKRWPTGQPTNIPNTVTNNVMFMDSWGLIFLISLVLKGNLQVNQIKCWACHARFCFSTMSGHGEVLAIFFGINDLNPLSHVTYLFFAAG